MPEDIKDLVFRSREHFAKFLSSMYFGDGDSVMLRVRKNETLLTMLNSLKHNPIVEFKLEGYEFRVYEIKDKKTQDSRYRLHAINFSKELKYLLEDIVPEDYADFIVK